YIWLGTRQRFDAFTFAFEETRWGWLQAHAYMFDQNMSTFIVEMPEENWYRVGLDRMTVEESVDFCQRVFAGSLGGHELLSNAPHLTQPWQHFLRVTNEHWAHENMVLLGDAAHTAHFSIGSGTNLALEDAIALARVLAEEQDIPSALQAYEA